MGTDDEKVKTHRQMLKRSYEINFWNKELNCTEETVRERRTGD